MHEWLVKRRQTRGSRHGGEPEGAQAEPARFRAGAARVGTETGGAVRRTRAEVRAQPEGEQGGRQPARRTQRRVHAEAGSGGWRRSRVLQGHIGTVAGAGGARRRGREGARGMRKARWMMRVHVSAATAGRADEGGAEQGDEGARRGVADGGWPVRAAGQTDFCSRPVFAAGHFSAGQYLQPDKQIFAAGQAASREQPAVPAARTGLHGRLEQHVHACNWLEQHVHACNRLEDARRGQTRCNQPEDAKRGRTCCSRGWRAAAGMGRVAAEEPAWRRGRCGRGGAGSGGAGQGRAGRSRYGGEDNAGRADAAGHGERETACTQGA
jgi:hypothetical protein